MRTLFDRENCCWRIVAAAAAVRAQSRSCCCCCWCVLNLCWCFESCCITYYLLPKSQIVQVGADVCVLGCRSVCEKHVIQQSFSFAFALLGCFFFVLLVCRDVVGIFAVLP